MGCSAVGDVPEALPVADEARAKEWRNKEYHEVRVRRLCCNRKRACNNKINNNRGVAQLVARLLWEQDVGSSSLFTPTIERAIPFGIALSIFVMLFNF